MVDSSGGRQGSGKSVTGNFRNQDIGEPVEKCPVDPDFIFDDKAIDPPLLAHVVADEPPPLLAHVVVDEPPPLLGHRIEVEDRRLVDVSQNAD